MTLISIVIGALATVNEGLIKGLKNLEIIGIIEIGQNTEKSQGDLRRLVVTQTSANADVKKSK